MTDKKLLGEVNMTNDEYHAAPGISCSHIKTLADGELDYFDKYVREPEPDQEPEAPRDDLVLGTAIHSAILEPDLFQSQFVEMPGFNLRSNAGKAERDAFVAENHGKTCLKPEDYLMALRCRDAVFGHPLAHKLFSSGRAETSTFAIDELTGELVKCRTDWENEALDAIVDVKSARSARQEDFERDAANLRYHFQPPWYFDVLERHRGWRPEHWIWLVIEKGRWPRVGVYYQPPEDIELDRIEVQRHFERLAELRRTGAWPRSYTDKEALPLGRPAWARRRAA